MSMTAYLRDRGPICYEKQIFDIDKESLLEFTERLLASGLTWHWESQPAHKEYGGVKRAATMLTSNVVPDFIDDLLEEDADGYGRAIALFGLDPDRESTVFDEAARQEMLAEFTQSEEGPIHAVIIRIEDIRDQYIYVRHRPIEPVGDLLASWEITSSTKMHTRHYEKLRGARLEVLYNLTQEREMKIFP